MNANLKTLKVAGKCQNTKWQENVKTLKVAEKCQNTKSGRKT